uniref:DNA-directed RNA polymerase n=1 Tax=Parascaris equorum TaxID=6256 RepID=A0A914R4Z4_PAREQ
MQIFRPPIVALRIVCCNFDCFCFVIPSSDFPPEYTTLCSSRVEEKRLEDEKSDDPDVKELAVALRAALPYPVPRKVIKQTVMTTVYGVTMYGATQQIKRQLKALEIESDEVIRCAFIPYV